MITPPLDPQRLILEAAFFAVAFLALAAARHPGIAVALAPIASSTSRWTAC